MSFFIKIYFAVILCVFTIPVAAADARVVNGKVIHVFDGDSFNLRTSSGKKYGVRLYGIDCPEKGQPYSNTARKFTTRLLHKNNISVDVLDVDQYRRLVGVVHVGSSNVNRQLLKQGLAWHYGRYCRELFCRGWKEFEQQARENRIGLWKDTSAIPPWNWRYQHRADQ